MATKVYNGFDLQGQRIQNMGDPSSSSDAATKAYVDNSLQGLQWKAPVRVASTANLAVASAVVNGATIDGVSVVTGDRVLLKNQTAPEENGIYIVAASGAASRASDLDTAAKAKSATVFVAEGTANGDKAFTQTGEIVTLGTTAQNWVQFGGAGSTYTAGSGLSESPANTFNVNTGTASATGLEISGGAVRIATDAAGGGLSGGGGSALSVNTGTASSTLLEVSGDAVRVSADAAGAGLTGGAGSALAVGAGSGITVNANDVALASSAAGAGLTYSTGVLAVGAGTGITVNADDIAINTSVVARKSSGDIGNGSSTSIAYTHNLGTKDVIVQLRLNSTDEAIIADWVATSTTQVTVTFASAPATNAVRITVLG
jgi:hypothetical protein